jgi:hypothetical protein
MKTVNRTAPGEIVRVTRADGLDLERRPWCKDAAPGARVCKLTPEETSALQDAAMSRRFPQSIDDSAEDPMTTRKDDSDAVQAFADFMAKKDASAAAAAANDPDEQRVQAAIRRMRTGYLRPLRANTLNTTPYDDDPGPPPKAAA